MARKQKTERPILTVGLVDDALLVRLFDTLREGGPVRLALVVSDLMRHAEKAFGWDPEETFRIVKREMANPTATITGSEPH